MCAECVQNVYRISAEYSSIYFTHIFLYIALNILRYVPRYRLSHVLVCTTLTELAHTRRGLQSFEESMIYFTGVVASTCMQHARHPHHTRQHTRPKLPQDMNSSPSSSPKSAPGSSLAHMGSGPSLSPGSRAKLHALHSLAVQYLPLSFSLVFENTLLLPAVGHAFPSLRASISASASAASSAPSFVPPPAAPAAPAAASPPSSATPAYSRAHGSTGTRGYESPIRHHAHFENDTKHNKLSLAVEELVNLHQSTYQRYAQQQQPQHQHTMDIYTNGLVPCSLAKAESAFNNPYASLPSPLPSTTVPKPLPKSDAELSTQVQTTSVAVWTTCVYTARANY